MGGKQKKLVEVEKRKKTEKICHKAKKVIFTPGNEQYHIAAMTDVDTGSNEQYPNTLIIYYRNDRGRC